MEGGREGGRGGREGRKEGGWEGVNASLIEAGTKRYQTKMGKTRPTLKTQPYGTSQRYRGRNCLWFDFCALILAASKANLQQ